MCTTTTDTLEIHAKLLPLEHQIQNLSYQAALCLASHPTSHPLHAPVQRAAKRFVMRHKSSLHHLFHASELDMESVETITHSRRPPSAISPYSINIANSREQAVVNHDLNEDKYKVYCDGSGIDDMIGATAVLYRRGRPQPCILHYHLGSADAHTVYEAEAVGLTLAARLLALEDDLTYPISIYVDNQATIKSGDMLSTKSGHYLIDNFRSSIKQLKKDSKDHNFKITIHWISGHDSEPATEIPMQGSVAQQPISTEAQRQESCARWARQWMKSPRYARTIRLDPHLTAARKSFTSLVQHLPKRHISLLLWLRTRHISLNQHLYRIGKSITPSCPHCVNTLEMVQHYLLICPQYV
ncbi:hypothetical protein DEU56DRAFT_726253 [Suillus clintonianus]|uniref:uncharacterized protein n=1 Tax=Suillus clintonianus TaxID=1904413 RepID=UPI001B87ECAA|nr:uncharacterized protein DEU56DRAFT_726253 [Suillus clintonianus]KAG2153822.1 hypothetical protein DEU56DRAFT_726253 [Suillus clintonianus]